MAISMTLFGGMDTDSPPIARDKTKHFRLKNGEIESDGQLSNLTIKNSKGNLHKYEFINAESTSQGEAVGRLRIIGSVSIDNYIIYFTTGSSYLDHDENNPVSGQIWRVTHDIISEEDVYTKKLLYNGKLDFTVNNPISAKARFINKDNIKVYFVDGVHPLRHVNIMDNKVIDMDVSNFDIIGEYNSSPINCNLRAGGSYKAGSVSYSYQLINYHGAETVYSEVSPPIHIGDMLPTNNDYHGTLSQVGTELNTGNGVQCDVSDIDDDYKYIRVVALFYTDYNAIPEVRVVYEGRIQSSISFFDDGNINLGAISYTEFATIGLFKFSPKLITNSSTRLAVGNIKEDYFDLNFDARTYRYNSSGTCLLGNSDGTVTEKLLINGGNGNLEIWKKNSSGTFILFYPTDGDKYIDRDHDCINTDPSTYKYKRDGITIGGEGPNVEYTVSEHWFKITDFDNSEPVMPLNNDGRLDAFGNEENDKYKGYMRNETYRFGLAAYDKHGMQSNVQWIGDIKMPTDNDTTSFDLISSDSIAVTDTTTVLNSFQFSYKDKWHNTRASVIVPKFTVKHLPDRAFNYQIVREERRKNDRSIISKGILNPPEVVVGGDGKLKPTLYYPNTVLSNGFPILDHQPPPGTSTAFYGLNRWAYYSSMVNDEFAYSNLKLLFYSPEVSYNMIDKADTKINVNGVMFATNANNSAYLNTGMHTLYSKYKPIAQLEGDINSSKTFGTSETLTLDGQSFVNQISRKHTDPGGGDDTTYWGRGGLGLLLGFSSAGDNPLLSATNTLDASLASMSSADKSIAVAYAELTTTLLSQYGGPSYNARSGRSYIQASTVQSFQDHEFITYGGDIFVGIMTAFKSHISSDVIVSNSYDPDESGVNLAISSTDFFPVETTINLDAKAHAQMSSLAEIPSSFKWLAQPKAGSHVSRGTTNRDSYSFKQEVDLYSYNSSYSKDNTSRYFYSKGVFSDELSHDKPNEVYVSKAAGGLLEEDNWLQYAPERKSIVDGSYGELSSITGFNDKIAYTQREAVGFFNIDPNTIIPTSEEEAVLGSQNAISKALYLSTDCGTGYMNSVTKGKNGVYFLDESNNDIFLLNKEILNLSKLHNISSEIKFRLTNNTSLYNLKVAKDVRDFRLHAFYNDDKIYFNVLTNNGKNHPTLVFDESRNSFTNSVDKLQTGLTTSHNNILYEVDNQMNQNVWQDGKGNYNDWYGREVGLELEFIISEGPMNKIFDTIEYNMLSKPEGSPAPGQLTKIEFIENDIALIEFKNESKFVKERFKKFRAQLPRHDKQNGSKVKARYMNNHARIKLYFTANNGMMNLLDMITHYRSTSMP